MKKNEILAIGLLMFICIVGFIGMCLRTEQIDNKKELSNTIANVNR